MVEKIPSPKLPLIFSILSALFVRLREFFSFCPHKKSTDWGWNVSDADGFIQNIYTTISSRTICYPRGHNLFCGNNRKYLCSLSSRLSHLHDRVESDFYNHWNDYHIPQFLGLL